MELFSESPWVSKKGTEKSVKECEQKKYWQSRESKFNVNNQGKQNLAEANSIHLLLFNNPAIDFIQPQKLRCTVFDFGPGVPVLSKVIILSFISGSFLWFWSRIGSVDQHGREERPLMTLAQKSVLSLAALRNHCCYHASSIYLLITPWRFPFLSFSLVAWVDRWGVGSSPSHLPVKLLTDMFFWWLIKHVPRPAGRWVCNRTL